MVNLEIVFEKCLIFDDSNLTIFKILVYLLYKKGAYV